MKNLIPLLLITLGVSLSVNVYANDAKHHQGKELHAKKCTSCHSDSVYSRKDRMVKTMSALEHQVNNCMKNAAKANWTPKQTSSVVSFLNTRYYKF